MEESPSRKNTQPTRRKDRNTSVDEGGDPIKCSGKNCRSCTGGVIADCIAVCCCPCAVLSFFTLAFFKAPYMMGRRCLGIEKKKKKKKLKECERQCERGEDASFENQGVEMQITEIGIQVEEEDQEEQDRVWMELYQLGHLGFGRVSFSGNQSQSKSN